MPRPGRFDGGRLQSARPGLDHPLPGTQVRGPRPPDLARGLSRPARGPGLPPVRSGAAPHARELTGEHSAAGAGVSVGWPLPQALKSVAAPVLAIAFLAAFIGMAGLVASVFLVNLRIVTERGRGSLLRHQSPRSDRRPIPGMGSPWIVGDCGSGGHFGRWQPHRHRRLLSEFSWHVAAAQMVERDEPRADGHLRFSCEMAGDGGRLRAGPSRVRRCLPLR